MDERIRVVAVDDHYLIKEAVTSLAQKHDEIALVATGSYGEDVQPLVEKHRPDVLLLDLSMPQHYGSQARFPALPTIAKLQREYPDTKIIILSALTVPTLVKGALKQNAPQAEIATQLGIQEPTVKSHLSNIYAALGVNNATAAILRAQELGLIDAK